MEQAERERVIVRTGALGIAVNLLLSAFKAGVGLLSGSIAIVLDAVNNLSDALSSIITILSVKLAAKPADREHPLGYGRVEYLSAIVISAIVLTAGVTSLIEAVRKMANPAPAEYTAISLMIIATAVMAKALLGLYTKRKGRECDSHSLIASGSDAFFDSLISLSTLLSALISLIWRVDLDALFALLISLVIVKAGFGMLSDTLDDILGKRADAALVHSLKSDIAAMGGVMGVYDLLLDSYGPRKLAGSVHLEVSEDVDAAFIDELSRNVTRMVYSKYGIYLTCGIYASPSPESPWHDKYLALKERLLEEEGVLQLHGFHGDEEKHIIFFDAVRSFDVKEIGPWIGKLESVAAPLFEGYEIRITADTDFSDI